MAELLRRSFDYKRIRSRGWLVPVVLLAPGMALVTYALLRLMGLAHPTPRFPLPAALVMFLAFFVAALGEELG